MPNRDESVGGGQGRGGHVSSLDLALALRGLCLSQPGEEFVGQGPVSPGGPGPPPSPTGA